MSYSPTENFASTFTPRSRGIESFPMASAIEGPMLTLERQRSTSVYISTSRGAASASMRSKAPLGSVFTFSFCSTTGTGMTSAKSSGGPR